MAEELHEIGDKPFLLGDGVLDVGVAGAAVAEEVERVDVEALGGEGGDHAGPVFTAGAEAVNEDEGLASALCRAGLRSSGL